jgi:hypothetical protein
MARQHAGGVEDRLAAADLDACWREQRLAAELVGADLERDRVRVDDLAKIIASSAERGLGSAGPRGPSSAGEVEELFDLFG